MDKHLDRSRYSRLSEAELKHLASCDFCMEQFADHIEEQELLTAPANLKEAILSRSQKADVQLVAKANEASRRLQLFYYSLKVGFATAFALALLLWSSDAFVPIHLFPDSQPQPMKRYEWQSPFSEVPIKEKIQDLSNQLFQTEVISHDKQEK